MADPRIFRSGYCLKGEVGVQTTVWYYGDDEYVAPNNSVREVEHRSLKVTIAKFDDVKQAAIKD